MKIRLATVLVIAQFTILPSVGLCTDYSFITVDVPGADHTYAYGINDQGQVVGYYAGTFNGNFGTHGFLDSGGTITTLQVPGTTQTLAFGINNRGTVVGTADGQGFIYSDGSYSLFNAPGGIQSYGGINANGEIVGNSGNHAFIMKNGVLTPYDVPGAKFTIAFAVNARGEIVGAFGDPITGRTRGFLLDGSTLTPIDVSGATAVIANGINAAEEITGIYDYLPPGASSVVGQSFVLNKGTLLPFPDVPGAAGTEVRGINDRGQIVGDWGDGKAFHGFVATPCEQDEHDEQDKQERGCVSLQPPHVPEPSTWLLLGSGFVGLTLWRKRIA